jgi:hypothetical protein
MVEPFLAYNGSEWFYKYRQCEGDSTVDYRQLSPTQLVDLFADKTQRNAAIVALIGGITAAELRRVNVSPVAKAALMAGLKHPNSKVRWWCIQLMDHIADETYLQPLLEAAQSDPTPKNRRHAIHAMTCEICKPKREKLNIDADLRATLSEIARLDSDASVRLMAIQELTEITAKSGE